MFPKMAYFDPDTHTVWFSRLIFKYYGEVLILKKQGGMREGMVMDHLGRTFTLSTFLTKFRHIIIIYFTSFHFYE